VPGVREIETIRERWDIGKPLCQTDSMKKSARASTALVAVGLVLAACGTAEEASPDTDPVAVTAAPADDADLVPNEGSSTEGEVVDEAEPAVETAPAAEAPADEAEPSGEAAEPPADEPAVTEAPPATEAAAPATEAPAAPVEAVIGGRALASELSAASDFADNILPDIQVDDIRSGQKVNFRNIFPAERPVLIWAWAPH